MDLLFQNLSTFSILQISEVLSEAKFSLFLVVVLHSDEYVEVSENYKSLFLIEFMKVNLILWAE
jgi:hypothetical protein